MADETTQDETQHADAATEAPEAGAEFPAADGAGSDGAVDGPVQPLSYDDAETAGAAEADAGPAGDAGTEGETPAPAPGAEGGSPAAGTDPVAGAADGPADAPAESSDQPVVTGFDAEPADDAQDAESAAADHGEPAGDAAVSAAPGGDADAAPTAPADAAPAEPDSEAPGAQTTAVDAPEGADAAGGGGDVELPYNCTGMAKLGTAGHDHGGPAEHPAPAAQPAPIDPTTGKQLSEEDHEKVTNGAPYHVALSRKDEPEAGDVGGAPVSHPAPARVPRPIDVSTGREVSEEQHELLTGGLHKGDEAKQPEGFEEEQS